MYFSFNFSLFKEEYLGISIFLIIAIFLVVIIAVLSYSLIYHLVKYLKDRKLSNLEFYTILLISLLVFFLFSSQNELVTAFLAIELQGVAFYVLASFKRGFHFSVSSGGKSFAIGFLSTALYLFIITLVYGSGFFEVSFLISIQEFISWILDLGVKFYFFLMVLIFAFRKLSCNLSTGSIARFLFKHSYWIPIFPPDPQSFEDIMAIDIEVIKDSLWVESITLNTREEREAVFLMSRLTLEEESVEFYNNQEHMENENSLNAASRCKLIKGSHPELNLPSMDGFRQAIFSRLGYDHGSPNVDIFMSEERVQQDFARQQRQLTGENMYDGLPEICNNSNDITELREFFQSPDQDVRGKVRWAEFLQTKNVVRNYRVEGSVVVADIRPRNPFFS